VSLRRTPFFRVLHRPRLFLGGEREPTLMMAIVAAGLAVSGQNLVAVIVAAVLWFGCIGLFRQMAKADPQMSRVYMRQIKYRGYYPPRSRPYRDAEKSSQWFYDITAVMTLALLYWMV
jgi:type IV secretory pathway TrbD component